MELEAVGGHNQFVSMTRSAASGKLLLDFLGRVENASALGCPTLNPDPGLVLLAGDLHGNTGTGLSVIDRAVEVGAATIAVLGDFGWRPSASHGRAFVEDLDSGLTETGVRLVWVDGNHESFDLLNAVPVDDNGLRPIRSHHAPAPRVPVDLGRVRLAGSGWCDESGPGTPAGGVLLVRARGNN